jgi:hypothetical protein
MALARPARARRLAIELGREGILTYLNEASVDNSKQQNAQVKRMTRDVTQASQPLQLNPHEE